MKVKRILEITQGKLLSGKGDFDIDLSSLSTDSRAVTKGSFFIALKGPNFDGASFIGEALERGAVGAMCANEETAKAAVGGEKILISVKDTTKAFQDIAREHRLAFKIPVIAVTGSNGKTAVKEMIAGILSKKYNILKNEGTRNNHIGVPQTLVKLAGSHDACVIELGTNHKGEVRLLSLIARPDIAVITNIGPSHLEFLRDLDGVFEAKKEIVEYLDKRKGVVIVNGDDRRLAGMKREGFRMVRYGLGEGNDIRGNIVSVKDGKICFTVNDGKPFELLLIGKHNVYNALAAISVSIELGIEFDVMQEALKHYKTTDRRLSVRTVCGISIIDDTYNSNPLSMKCAIEAIGGLPAKSRWIVAGDMMELGKDAVRFHRSIGKDMARSRIDGLLTIGELSKYTRLEAIANGLDESRACHCESHDEAANFLKKYLVSGDLVLFKGSRALEMEKVILKLEAGMDKKPDERNAKISIGKD